MSESAKSYTTMMQEYGAALKESVPALLQYPDDRLDALLSDIAAAIESNADFILLENQKDIEAAQGKNLSAAMMDRLRLTPERVQAIAQGVRAIAALPHPVGEVLEDWTRPNGLRIQKIAVPIGILGMIYESRPNVTVDAAALALKSRNVILLRGGSESFYSSRAMHRILQECIKAHDLNASCVSMVDTTDRAMVDAMLAASDVIDVMIPRGGKGLTSKVMEQAKMPVFAHLDGNCHIYVHSSAGHDMALAVVKNAKLRRTGICGATESLLLDSDLPRDNACAIVSMLLDSGVEIVGDAMVQSWDNRIKLASDADWSAEYLDKKISIKCVAGVEEAVRHINHYGSHHTDSILAEDQRAADYFTRYVDSATVMHNASTQFADGGEFGFGAEIGIGTGKLHARGPVGLRQLCTFKYKVSGTGQTRPV